MALPVLQSGERSKKRARRREERRLTAACEAVADLNKRAAKAMQAIRGLRADTIHTHDSSESIELSFGSLHVCAKRRATPANVVYLGPSGMRPREKDRWSYTVHVKLPERLAGDGDLVFPAGHDTELNSSADCVRDEELLVCGELGLELRLGLRELEESVRDETLARAQRDWEAQLRSAEDFGRSGYLADRLLERL